MATWNTALMASHSWRILSNKESLWVKWIHSYRLGGRNFWDAPIKSGIGGGCRNILNMREKIRDFIISQIGDGSATSAWFDNWHPVGPLSRIFTPRDIHQAGFSPISTVKDLVFDGRWVRPHLWLSSVDSLKDCPPPVLVPSSHDKLLWRKRSGGLTDFSVSEVWLNIRPNEPEVDWHHLVWFSQNIPRHAFILWVALKERLKTHDKIRAWEPSANLSCAFCGNCPDSHSHLFFECSYPSQVWDELTALMNIRRVGNKWRDVLGILKRGSKGKSIWAIIRRLVLAGAVYHIWMERNNRIFKNKRRPCESVVKTITDDIRSRLLSLSLKPSANVTKAKILWKLPLKDEDTATNHPP